MTVTGYLDAVVNPNFSGLATVRVRTNKNPRRGRKVYGAAEAGFGVRQLVSAFGDGRTFTKRSGEIRARFTFDDLGLLAQVEVLD